jgi:transcription antitermination factor NusG
VCIAPSAARREDSESPLFPGYAFIAIELQWHAARWYIGVRRLIMDGVQPAKVPDAVIEEIRARERKGAVELSRRLLKPGDRASRCRTLSPKSGGRAERRGKKAPAR